MAVRFLFFNSTPTDDRVYYAQDFADTFDKTHESGLLHPYGQGQLNLKAEVKEGMTSIVNTGLATLGGHYFEVFGEPYELAHQLPDATYNRIDRIVIRLDNTHNERKILPHVKHGNPAQTPQPPELTRNKDIYEISLGQILVRANTGQLNPADLIDERFDDNLCGPAYLKLPIPPQQIQDVMDAWFASEDKAMFLQRSEKGAVNGIAPLNAQRKIDNQYISFPDFILRSEKGAVNGVASLDANGRVFEKQLGYFGPSNSVIIRLPDKLGQRISSGLTSPGNIIGTFPSPENGKLRVIGKVKNTISTSQRNISLRLVDRSGFVVSPEYALILPALNTTGVFNFTIDMNVSVIVSNQLTLQSASNSGDIVVDVTELEVRGSRL